MYITTNFQDFVWNYKEPIVLTSTVGLIAATCFEYLTLDMLRYSFASGIISGCCMQLLGIAVGRKGISDPKNAPLVTNLLTAINLATWLMYPSNPFTLSVALCNLAFKVSTVAFQSFYQE